MFARGDVIIQMLERLAPRHYAAPSDRERIGLQVGSATREVRRVLVCLDVTPAVAAEAAELGAGLIVAHHAFIFRPLAHLKTDTPKGAVAAELLKRDIAVYVMHTNLDAAEGGINDWFAEALGMQDCRVLEEVHSERLFKLAVFVPRSHQDAVRDALFAAGAGHIGNYSHCSFNIDGIGTFMPQEGTDPFIGRQGKLEKVEEVRIETVVPDGVLQQVIGAMLRAHPYEEVAYDLYPIEVKGRAVGFGRLGTLPEPETLASFAERVKRGLDVPFVRVVGPDSHLIRKVAVLGGAGPDFAKIALQAGADVLVTGDIDYHTALDAEAAGLALVDPGHFAEKIMKANLAAWLQERLAAEGYATEVIVSQVEKDPFRVL
jgi:dinuclear metal center YbgI/SA1388 family protein